jgi:hypothetical protein
MKHCPDCNQVIAKFLTDFSDDPQYMEACVNEDCYYNDPANYAESLFLDKADEEYSLITQS